MTAYGRWFMSHMALQMRAIPENLLPVLLIGSFGRCIQKEYTKRLPALHELLSCLSWSSSSTWPQVVWPSSPIWSEVIHPLYSMTLNSSYSETSIRGLPQLQLQQPSPLTYYFVFHHFLGLYICDIDSPTACVSRGLPTELLFFIPVSQSQYFLLRIIYISQ